MAAARWLLSGGMNWQACKCDTTLGSALVFCMADQLADHVTSLCRLTEEGLINVAINAETPELALLLLWKHVNPAAEGFARDDLRASLKFIPEDLDP